MPKLPPKRLESRRQAILEAAERAFARDGFHGTSMQNICREAGISPGTLYLYFPSKVALIAGLCERDRNEIKAALIEVENAPNILEALEDMLVHYACVEPHERRALMFEIGAEALRNPDIAKLMTETDDAFTAMIRATVVGAVDAGRITPQGDIDTIFDLLSALGDGILWRATLRPDLDHRNSIRRIFALVRQQLLTSTTDTPLACPA